MEAPNPYLVNAYARLMYPEKSEQINQQFLHERTQAVVQQTKAAIMERPNPFDEVRRQVEISHAAWRAKWTARFHNPQKK